MSIRMPVRPELITWARERSRIPFDELAGRYPRLAEWENGAASPTLKQLERFAASTHAAMGFLFLPQPPEEHLPLPDFRTLGDEALRRPSPDLLDTIFLCQKRQDWYRDHARGMGEDAIGVVGSLTTETPVTEAAATIRQDLGFDVGERGSSWADAFARLAEKAERLGILVMTSGVVGSNTHRPLAPEEFRGFVLIDPLAPVVFVNGADTKPAQIFTLAHELAHVWVGQSGLTDAGMESIPGPAIEGWCNQVAAEMLVPLAALRELPAGSLREALESLARRFKVSTLVILRRIYDAGHLDPGQYRAAYRTELNRVLQLVANRPAGGGNFYNTQPVRTSKLFARAVIGSALEGQTLYRDAFQMLGFRKLATFQELAHRLGVA